MWLAFKMTGESIYRIAREFRRDEARVRRAIRRVDERREWSPSFRARTDRLCERYAERAPPEPEPRANRRGVRGFGSPYFCRRSGDRR